MDAIFETTQRENAHLVPPPASGGVCEGLARGGRFVAVSGRTCALQEWQDVPPSRGPARQAQPGFKAPALVIAFKNSALKEATRNHQRNLLRSHTRSPWGARWRQTWQGRDCEHWLSPRWLIVGVLESCVNSAVSRFGRKHEQKAAARDHLTRSVWPWSGRPRGCGSMPHPGVIEPLTHSIYTKRPVMTRGKTMQRTARNTRMGPGGGGGRGGGPSVVFLAYR
ncbi:hypothetical protein GWK47_033709 [Chionoecetes opilio]|uniref:Uncharacterized protein n=1 Tax=Chionoecetes opilio TaxID=41210 RepID=A0A8J5CPG0_CHIOP|nr:hypothetical protein GWK47_033709 [Chionoecetes opilio]